MKKVVLISLILSLSMIGFSQTHVYGPKEARNHAVEMVRIDNALDMGNNEVLPANVTDWPPEEDFVGYTIYDWQTNAGGLEGRIHLYEDGTIGAVYTYGLNSPSYADRGTGYNYFDGNDWINEVNGSPPNPVLDRIEDQRCGWPSYAPYGENGEINVAHTGGNDGLIISKRDTKGEGDWTTTFLVGPSGHEDLLFPRLATGGVNNSVLYVISVTASSAFGGTAYEGLDGAFLFSKSLDGGESWEIENQILDGLSESDGYTAFNQDSYEIQADGDNVVIVVGDSWSDLILMKSADAGESWEKTIIWDGPYSDWSGEPTDTFYTAQGLHCFDVDNNGMVHVAFGINRALSVDGSAQSYFPGVDGIGYWNESRPTFSDDINALNPYGHPDSELEDDYSLIAWAQDVDNDGVINITWDNLAGYNCGISSQPQIEVDDNDNIYIVFSSVTEEPNGPNPPENQSYRRLWIRASGFGGDSWGGFRNLTEDLAHIFDECVYPSMATNSDDNLYLIYQTDAVPGSGAIGNTELTDNYIRFMKIDKADIPLDIDENKMLLSQNDVSQNFPNPFSENSTVVVNLKEKANLSLEVVNVTGQKVYEVRTGNANAGTNRMIIDGSKLSPGIYFYTVKAGDSSVTKKMIVE
ncbi:MAG: T9SS type A sorting domain-containing protein [Chlorobi bacterium]|nr:T9SS type A sorting domain-containing protein [Chlorobiota bacterium]